MIISLDTSDPICKMTLFHPDGKKLAQKDWPANRELAKKLLTEIEIFLKANQLDWSKLTGLVLFRGPGSFTGLRVGAAVMNTLADSLNIPIIGAVKENWQVSGLTLLRSGQNHQLILPKYGSPPHITQAKK